MFLKCPDILAYFDITSIFCIYSFQKGDISYINAKEINQSNPDYVYDPAFKQAVNEKDSSVHIPVEIYEGGKMSL